MKREEVRIYVNKYCHLRDVQYAAYELYARKHGLSAKELFVLDILWFEPEGCQQSAICERMSATKQTISAIIKKFEKQGYVYMEPSATDHRNKIIRFTKEGVHYTEKIIPPAANAEIDAMAELDMSGEDIAELVRLTTLFSKQMAKKFSEAKEM